MNEVNQNKATLTEREFCAQVGISRTTAWRLREAGKLAHCRIGNKVFYLHRHIDEFLSAHEHPAKQARRVSVAGKQS